MEQRPPILQWKVFLALVGVVVVAVTLGSALGPASQPNMTLGTTYSQAAVYAERGQLTHVVFQPAKQEIDATLRDGTKIVVNYPTDQSATQFQNLLEAHHVKFDSSGNGGWTGYVPFLHGKAAARMNKCMQHRMSTRKLQRCLAAVYKRVDTNANPNRR